MDLQLLGPVEATIHGRPIPLGATKQRAMLAMLALEANATVPVDRLVDGLWSEDPPATASKMVQLYVSQLRRLFDGNGAAIVTHGRGYELRLDSDCVDAARFERAVDEAGRGDGASGAREALTLWHGDALANVADEPFAPAEIRRLEDLRLRATELAIAADLAAGRHREVLGELETLVAAHPLSERLHGQRMLALYRSGRQAEALEAYTAARRVLVDEIGVEPGPELRALHDAILRQDSATLDLPAQPRAAERVTAAPPPGVARAAAPVRRGRWLVVAAAVLLVAGGAAFAVSRLTSGDSQTRIDENAVGVVDSDGQITAQYSVGRDPGAVVAGDGSMWIASRQDGTITRIDRGHDPTVTTRIKVGGAPSGLAFGAGALWIADGESRTVSQVDPGTNARGQSIDVGNAPRALAAGYGALWVASSADSAVRRVDLRSGAPSRTIPLSSSATAIAAGEGAIWVASEEAGTVTRLEPRRGKVVTSIPVGNGPSAVAVGQGAVWSVSRDDGTLWRIDPRTNAVAWSAHVGGDPVAVAAGDGAVWVAGSDAGTVTRVDPDTGDVLDPVPVGGSPAGVAVFENAAWVAAGAPSSSHRGGTLRLLYANNQTPEHRFPIDWLDEWSYNFWTGQMIALAYDGLVAYRRVGGPAGTELVGALATRAPAPSPDGLTYVFTLRPGLRYSDGRPVDAADFRASMERFLQVTRTQDFPPYYAAIVGAGRCMRGLGRCDLSKGIEIDAQARTITVHLSHPDADFLHKLTTAWAYVVPADAPRDFFGDRLPPGTGPYRFAAWDVAKGGYLVRNPYFRRPPQERPAGFADRIEVRVENIAQMRAQVAEVRRGAADLTHVMTGHGGGFYPPARLPALAATAPGQLHSWPVQDLEYFYLNVRRPPFDHVRVRRALNYATDRSRVVELTGGTALSVPACQMLPATFPGYAPFCPYTAQPGEGRGWTAPDMERARKLVAESGTAGERVVVVMPDWRREVGRYLEQLLDDLGYRASLRVVPGATWNPYGKSWQIGYGVFGPDFNSPSGFIEPMFDCSSPEKTNPSYFCDRGFDRQVEQARAARGAEALRRWAAIDRTVTGLAPVVPLVTGRAIALVSKRVGNLQDRAEGPLLDQIWVQ
jgi:ABC-type transport system substrate-binding protein/DNA-binding SARP family transcriptional activator